MSEESTRNLEGTLASVGKSVDSEIFVSEHESKYRFFYEFLNDYIAENGLDITDIITRSRISKNYVYQITNGVKKRPTRDKIIALSIAAGMDVAHVNRSLRIGGCNALYPKNKRDIYIAECINLGKTDITDVNIILDEKGVELLDV